MTGLEIAVTTVAGARLARDLGATRVELCSALELGGVTPSQGLLEAVLDEVGGRDGAWEGVQVLVRPRPGDFVYDAADADLYERELRAVLAAGADGVVVGGLTPQGRPDLALVHRLAEPAREVGATVTFHRALDHAPDVVRAFASLGDAVDRVLTSGGAASATAGAATLAEMVAAGGPAVMAGGGVTPTTIPDLVALGVDAVHLSAKRAVGEDSPLSLGVGDDGRRLVTDPDVVAAAVRALGAVGA